MSKFNIDINQSAYSNKTASNARLPGHIKPGEESKSVLEAIQLYNAVGDDDSSSFSSYREDP